MKRHLIYFFLLSGGMLFLMSCEKDYFMKEEKVEITAPVSFSADIYPIISPKCASAACHGGSVAPNLASASDAAVLLLDYIDLDNPEASPLYDRITSTAYSSGFAMPPQQADRLSESQIGFILAWIKQGALNN
jgi:hypothetical protein